MTEVLKHWNFSNTEILYKTYLKLNKNGLCKNVNDIQEFLIDHNNLLKQDINLESYGNPFPARLSRVEL